MRMIRVYEGSGKGSQALGSWYYIFEGRSGGPYANEQVATGCAIRDFNAAWGDEAEREVTVKPAQYPEWWGQPHWRELKTDADRMARIKHWIDHPGEKDPPPVEWLKWLHGKLSALSLLLVG